MMCISMNDPGMIVLPTHRLFRGLPPLTSEQLVARLGDCFVARTMGEGADLAEMVWDTIETADDQRSIGLFTTADQRWILVKLTDAGRARMSEVASSESTDWQGLGVSILHRLIIETLLDAPDLPKPTYVHQVQEVIDGLQHGDSEGGDYPLAALVMPATVHQIRAIGEQGERMPAKSTYFYPKLLSGLVINPLDSD
jgi:hypothetical protein